MRASGRARVSAAVTAAFAMTALQLSACGGGGSGARADAGGPVDAMDIRRDGDDPGVRTTLLVRASEGGELTAGDGATLLIPPGALAADTMITLAVPTGQAQDDGVRTYLLEPAGLTFSTPATLRIPWTDPQGRGHGIYQSSTLNDIAKQGDDSSNWLPAEVASVDTDAVNVKVEHFTFFFAFQEFDELAYLVIDMPSRYLLPGDLLFTLTNVHVLPGVFGDGFDWSPGHVGVFTGGPDNTLNVIESNDDRVRRAKLGPFKTNNHLYLGPRRRAGMELTVGDRISMVDFLESRLGNGYSIVGQSIVNPSDDSYSCVSLAEAGYDSVGKGLLSSFTSATASTPLELFQQTVPITELTEDVGVEIKIPIYGATLDNDNSRIFPTSHVVYQNKIGYTIAAASLPDTATFTATEGVPGYVFKWTPGPEHAGMTFMVPLQMDVPVAGVETLFGFANLGPVTKNETLVIHIRPLAESACADPAAPMTSLSTSEETACRIGGAQAVSDQRASVYPVATGGMYGNSNPTIQDQLIVELLDYFEIAAFVLGLSPEDLARAFLNTDYPCGTGLYGLTLCPAQDALTLAAGEFVVVQAATLAAIPLADPTYSYQYGFVFDADGIEANNYQAQAPYADDYFQGTDRWYAAEYTPAAGWRLQVTLARGSVQTVASGARLVIADNTLTLVVPAEELEVSAPPYRVTAFRHRGDYGQNPPYDYSADAHPAVRTPLEQLVVGAD